MKLCGGTLFTLMTRAMNPDTRTTNGANGPIEGISYQSMMKALIRIYDPSVRFFPDQFSRYVTPYRSCQRDSNTYVNFTDPKITKTFRERVENDFPVVLEGMSDLVGKFINKDNYGKWLIRALIELIDSDESVKQDSVFYVRQDGTTLTFTDLKGQSKICLEVFLLYTFLYIVTENIKNSEGKSTYDAWYRKSETNNAQPEYIGTIGDSEERLVELVSPKEYLVRETVPEKQLRQLAATKSVVNGSGFNYLPYLRAAEERHGKIKTMLYSQAPHPFYDFYVCNNVCYQERVQESGVTRFRRRFISGLTIDEIEKRSNFILLAGSGGLGKSMMLRNLLLTAVKNYLPGKCVPVFVSLKEYDGDNKEISEFIFESLNSFAPSINRDTFSADLAAGQYAILFDGMDEISSAYRGRFESRLSKFVDAYSNNVIVVSARPYSDFVSLSRFTVMQLMPFNKNQALELIRKLDFEPVEIKQSFYEQLDLRLYHSHKAFTENPLLLTLMLMTYSEHLDVPSRMHIFYSEAYDVLATRHDSHKDTPVHRSLKTGITKDRFKDYMAEFCASSYTKEKFEFTQSEIESIFNKLKCKAADEEKTGAITSSSDFIEDVTTSLCIMFYESGKYHFIHRSFQEYFCALYFSKLMDNYLPAIGKFFEKDKRGKMRGDQTFEMLYDMIPDKMEKYIFTPFLQNLFDDCDAHEGYLSFLGIIYYYLVYFTGNVDFIVDNEPASYTYNFIAKHAEFKECMSHLELPDEDDFLETRLVYQCFDLNPGETEEDRVWETVPENEVRDGYVEEYGEPEESGREYSIDIDYLIQNKENYGFLIERLSAPSFPAKKEYEAARVYLQKLKEKHSQKESSLSELFG